MAEGKVKLPYEDNEPKGDGNESKGDASQSTENTVTIDNETYSLNENGDAVKEDGSVFKTKDELAKPKEDAPGKDKGDDKTDTPEEIEIDGQKYNLDKEGNAVDSDGKVKFTKEQMDKFEEEAEGDESEDKSSLKVKDVQKLTNFVPVDESGKPVEYEDTEEGLSSYISDVYNSAVEQHKNDVYNQIASRYPVLPSIIKHLQLNDGKLDGFGNQTDYKSMKLSDSDDQNKQFIVEARLAKGDTQEEAERYVKYVEDDSRVKEESKSSLKFLQDKQAERDADMDKQIKDKEQAEIEEDNKYWGVQVSDDGKLVPLNEKDSIYNKVVVEGQLNVGDKTYKIPDKIRVSENGKQQIYDRAEFFRYMYEPRQYRVGNEVITATAYEVDSELNKSKRKTDDDVFDAYKMFVGNDTSQFIEKEIQQEQAKRIKKLKSKKTDSGKQNDRGNEGNAKVKLPFEI